MTLYYVLSTIPSPLDPLIGSEDREKMEASLNYTEHCFSRFVVNEACGVNSVILPVEL